MRNRYDKYTVVFFSIIFLSLSSDIVTKMMAIGILGDRTSTLIPHILSLQLVKNSGVAFGTQIPFLAIITPIIIIAIMSHYWRTERPKQNMTLNIGFALLLGGALGNAWERIWYGEVTDFIFVSYFSVFNLADIFICLGCILIFWQYYRAHQQLMAPAHL